MEKTLIPGKDAALEDSIARMQGALKALGFDIEEASWLNPVPHVWSVHIRDRTCPLMFTNGKGASRKAALASALGEYFERLSCNYFFADFALGDAVAHAPFVHYPDERWFPLEGDGAEWPEGLLDDAALRAFYDPEGELTPAHLVDTNSGNRARGVCAVPYRRVSDGRTVYFPVNLIGNLYVSNGMSAGNTEAEARVQGLSEVFERHVKNKIIREGIALPDVPADVLARYPKVVEAIRELESHGFHILVKDASLGGVFPVMNVTLINPRDGGCFASFGAHPRFDVALERTLTELLQGRNLDQLNVFHAPSFDDEEVASDQNLEEHFIDASGVVSWSFFRAEPDHPFTPWDFGGTTSEEYARLTRQIHDLGFQVYIADYRHLGTYACRIVVPGMSEIYPVSDLLWENNNAGVALRADILRMPTLDAAALRDLYHEVSHAGFVDEVTVAHVIGLAPDPGTAWAELRVGELKALLAVAAGELEEAQEWVQWCLMFGNMGEAKTRRYQCLAALLRMATEEGHDLDGYRHVVGKVYGEDAFASALAILEGRDRFPGLTASDTSFRGFAWHQALLAGYAKLQRAKAAHWATL